MTADSVRDAVHAQLADWDHLGPGDVAILLTAADAIDTLSDAVAEGAAALPLVNACRYAYDLLRKAAPPSSADTGVTGVAAVLSEWLDD